MNANRPLVAPLFEAWTLAVIIVSGWHAAALDELDGLFGLSFLIQLALVLAITRRRSRLARTILTMMIALTIIVMVTAVSRLLTLYWSDWVLTGSTLVDLALIWSPAMSRWLKSRPDPELGSELLVGCGKVILIALGIAAAMLALGLWPG